MKIVDFPQDLSANQPVVSRNSYLEIAVAGFIFILPVLVLFLIAK